MTIKKMVTIINFTIRAATAIKFIRLLLLKLGNSAKDNHSINWLYEKRHKTKSSASEVHKQTLVHNLLQRLQHLATCGPYTSLSWFILACNKKCNSGVHYSRALWCCVWLYYITAVSG